ncbi:glutaredoxin family protein [Arsukibacterium sp.]|uniref:glutaredoxin family protein n=1 Tax=Arsukibacterium sp. TaxID=1977258 RepID=UPI00299D7A3E|nr:glutaredoxin family protein [Arsukibacterium sp.]MDX1537896.1 glutaredoxin family protein [Arsukibacterium sp.]
MAQYILYSTWGCHLCEEAEALLIAAGLEFQVVDIIDDEQLLQQFRLHIPVISADDNLLYWPFDQAAVGNWLETIKVKESK